MFEKEEQNNIARPQRLLGEIDDMGIQFSQPIYVERWIFPESEKYRSISTYFIRSYKFMIWS